MCNSMHIMSKWDLLSGIGNAWPDFGGKRLDAWLLRSLFSAARSPKIIGTSEHKNITPLSQGTPQCGCGTVWSYSVSFQTSSGLQDGPKTNSLLRKTLRRIVRKSQPDLSRDRKENEPRRHGSSGRRGGLGR